MSPIRVTFAAVAVALIVMSGAASGLSSAAPRPSNAGTSAAIGPTSPIKHVVVYLLENHSFDNLLGPYCARRVPPCNGVDIGATVHLKNGSVATVKTSPDIVLSINHEPFAQRRAWDGGKDDGWNQVPGCDVAQGDYQCISAYTPDQVFTLSALADQYALSDNTMTCDMVPSAADHFEWQTGCQLEGFRGDNPTKDKSDPLSTGGPGNGCISKLKTPWGRSLTPEPSCFPDYGLPAAQYPNGGAFEPTPVPTTDGETLTEQCAANPPCTWTQYGGTRKDWGARLQDGEKDWAFYWSTTAWFAQLYFTGLNHVVPADRFLTDAADGTLPTITYLTPTFSDCNDSEHNGASITCGEDDMARAVNALRNGPDWSSTAMFITYDDCGCFYDHVSPQRVPMVIVSPYAKPHFVDSTPADFSGVIHFIDEVSGLPAQNARVANSYDFANAFDFSQAVARPGAPLPTRPIPPSSLRFLRSHPDAARGES